MNQHVPLRPLPESPEDQTSQLFTVVYTALLSLPMGVSIYIKKCHQASSWSVMADLRVFMEVAIGTHYVIQETRPLSVLNLIRFAGA